MTAEEGDRMFQSTATLYFSAQAALILGEIDWATDDIKVMFCTSDYEPALTDRYRSDIHHEVQGVGYESGGTPLTGRTVTTADAGYTTVWDADDAASALSTITARYAIVYKDTGDPATSPLICYLRFEVEIWTKMGQITLEWGPNGIVRFPRIKVPARPLVSTGPSSPAVRAYEDIRRDLQGWSDA